MLPQTYNLKNDQIATPGGISASDTTFTLLAGTVFGSPPTKVVIKVDNELMRVTIAGTAVTQAERNYKNASVAVAHLQTASVTGVTPAEYINACLRHIEYGWTDIPDYLTASYVSAGTFTLPGDWTTTFSKGDRFMLTNNGTTKYFYGVSYSLGDGITTVNVSGGSDYSLVVTGGVTAISFSKAASPAGFPGSFNFNPAPTGFSAVTVTTSRFSMFGSLVSIRLFLDGTSNSTAFGGTVPINALVGGRTGTVSVFDNGTWQAVAGIVSLAAGAASMTFYKDANGTAFTNVGGKGVDCSLSYFS